MEFTHLNDKGLPQMVDVSQKNVTHRVAKACGRIYVGDKVMAAIRGSALPKGDIFTTAKLAGIMAAKRTSELIPLCHNVFLSFIDISYTADYEGGYIEAISEVRTTAQTGAEMEALTAVLVFLETVYDMCKAVEKKMVITDVRVIEKRGGKSGDWSYDHTCAKTDERLGRVVSINISGQKGTVKQPVSEAVLIEDFGIEGDAHAGSGHRQVSLLDVASIKKMEQYGLMGLCFGRFAENITTEGLNLSVIKVGTRLKIGDEAIIEISQIGKKCHGDGCEISRTVGVCIMPREGLFAKVLRGGRVKTGDTIEVMG